MIDQVYVGAVAAVVLGANGLCVYKAFRHERKARNGKQENTFGSAERGSPKVIWRREGDARGQLPGGGQEDG
jgi:hypothetical protein